MNTAVAGSKRYTAPVSPDPTNTVPSGSASIEAAHVETVINGERVQGVHEALDLDRYKQPMLKPMLAVRVPRRAAWSFSDAP